jgi:hypothetical protein
MVRPTRQKHGNRIIAARLEFDQPFQIIAQIDIPRAHHRENRSGIG